MTTLSRAVLTTILCASLPFSGYAAESQVGYSVVYSGGSLPNVKSGEELKLYLGAAQIRLKHKSQPVFDVPTKAITDLSYGQEVHRRIGTAAGLAVVSLGIGALVAFSKSKKHYIGITWANGDDKGGVVLQADKNEYRGLLAALEGVSGKTAVDTDSPKQVPTQTAAISNQPAGPPASEAMAEAPLPIIPPPPPVPVEAPNAVAKAVGAAPRAQSGSGPETLKGIVVRFASTPVSAEVQVDGEYWGTTPTADFTRISAGSHVILVKKIGYQPWERKITLFAGDDRTIDAELEPESKDTAKPRISGSN
jgi:PEGA domain